MHGKTGVVACMVESELFRVFDGPAGQVGEDRIRSDVTRFVDFGTSGQDFRIFVILVFTLFCTNERV